MDHIIGLNLTKLIFVSNENTLLPLHERMTVNQRLLTVITSNNAGVNLLHLFNGIQQSVDNQISFLSVDDFGILDVNTKDVEENFWFKIKNLFLKTQTDCFTLFKDDL